MHATILSQETLGYLGGHDLFEVAGFTLAKVFVKVVALERRHEREELWLAFVALAHGAQRHALDVFHRHGLAELHGCFLESKATLMHAHYWRM